MSCHLELTTLLLHAQPGPWHCSSHSFDPPPRKRPRGDLCLSSMVLYCYLQRVPSHLMAAYAFDPSMYGSGSLGLRTAWSIQRGPVWGVGRRRCLPAKRTNCNKRVCLCGANKNNTLHYTLMFLFETGSYSVALAALELTL